MKRSLALSLLTPLFLACSGGAGPAGPTGSAGPMGAPGAAGAVGPAGAAGSQGASGPQGPAGNEGVAGPQGASGPAGSTGPAGPAGPAGQNGAVGAAGATGPAGAAGAQGAMGIANYGRAEWIGSISAPVNSWSTLGSSIIQATTSGGPIQFTISIPMSGGSHSLCQPTVDGNWAGSYDSKQAQLNPPNIYYKEGLIYTGGGGWWMWNKTKTYYGIPAGNHTFFVQCTTDGGTVTVGRGDSVSTFEFLELPKTM